MKSEESKSLFSSIDYNSLSLDCSSAPKGESDSSSLESNFTIMVIYSKINMKG